MRALGMPTRETTGKCVFLIRARIVGGGIQTTCLTKVDGFPGPGAHQALRGSIVGGTGNYRRVRGTVTGGGSVVDRRERLGPVTLRYTLSFR